MFRNRYPTLTSKAPYLGISSNGLSTLIDKMQGHGIYAHIDLRKGERSELAELASNIL
jgi:PhoH-like ATPase